MDKQEVLDRSFLIALTGSRAYKTHNPESDSDYKGICIGLKPHYFGFSKFEQKDKGWEDTPAPFDYLGRDTVIYEIRKFFNLAYNNNPNILDMFYSPEYKLLTPIGEKLLKNRDLFISKKCKFTFSGYAFAQAHKIEMHRKWLLNPPKHKPTLEEFGLTDNYQLNKNEINAFIEFLYQLVRNRIEYLEEKEMLELELIKMIQGDIDFKQILKEVDIPDDAIPYAQKLTGASDNYIHLLQKTHSYNTAKKHWDNYQRWKKNRNPERAKLEAKIGFDCYLDDTEFLTNNGWKNYYDITNNDLLGTLNPDSHTLEFQKFTNRICKKYTGDIYNLTSKHMNCAVTPTHTMYVSKLHRSKKNNWSTKYDPSTANWKLIPLQDLINSPYSNYAVIRCPKENNLIDYPDVTDEYLLLLGCYISEGCINKKKPRKDGTCFQNLRIEQKHGNKMQSILDNFCKIFPQFYRYDKKVNLKHMLDKNYKGYIYICSDQNLIEKLIQDAGVGSFEKRLPSWVMSLSKRQVKVLLNGLLAGDGSYKKYSAIYHSANKELCNDIQIMCLNAGIVTQLWGPFETKTNFCKEGQTCKMYQLYIREQDIYNRQIISVKNKRFSSNKVNEQIGFRKFSVENQNVVCFEVPNSILITRRKGCLAIQGNCKHGMHLIRLMRMGCEILEGKGVIVDREIAGDAEELKFIRNGNMPYDDLMNEFKKLEEKIDYLYKNSPLQHSPPQEKIEQLCIQLIEESQML